MKNATKKEGGGGLELGGEGRNLLIISGSFYNFNPAQGKWRNLKSLIKPLLEEANGLLLVLVAVEVEAAR